MRFAKNVTSAVITAVLAGIAATPGFAQTLAEALKNSEPSVVLRYRLEHVSRDVADEKDALASTLRTALALETGEWRHAKAFVEVENITVIGDERYNNRGAGSHANGMTGRAVVADPSLTEINQAYLEVGKGGARVRLGRQEILLGDHRFVGHVGWRQNHQSYDALRLDHEWGEKLSLTYGFIDRVQRIFGDSRGLDGHLLELALGEAGGKVRLYGLSLDWDDASQAALSTTTLGAEFTGSRPFGAASALYEAEWATQQDTGNNPGTVEADYLHLMLGGQRGSTAARLGYEVLEGSASNGAFTTPLATLHKFNGWADIFLATPPNGLVDTYLQLDGQRGAITWTGRYHEFQADSGSLDYGSEVDGQLSYKAQWGQVFALTASLYSADGLGVDTDKWMFWTSYSF